MAEVLDAARDGATRPGARRLGAAIIAAVPAAATAAAAGATDPAWPPARVSRSCVASMCDSATFAKIVAQEAYARHFFAARMPRSFAISKSTKSA